MYTTGAFVIAFVGRLVKRVRRLSPCRYGRTDTLALVQYRVLLPVLLITGQMRIPLKHLEVRLWAVPAHRLLTGGFGTWVSARPTRAVDHRLRCRQRRRFPLDGGSATAVEHPPGSSLAGSWPVVPEAARRAPRQRCVGRTTLSGAELAGSARWLRVCAASIIENRLPVRRLLRQRSISRTVTAMGLRRWHVCRRGRSPVCSSTRLSDRVRNRPLEHGSPGHC